MQSPRILSAAIVLGLLFSGCSKNDSTSTTPSNPSSTAFSYTIDGVSDLSLKQAGAVNVPVTIRTAAGTSEVVTLVATGVPDNVQIGFTPPSGEPSFSTTMTIVAALDAKAGAYPVKVVGTSKSGVVVEKAFRLTLRNQNCAQDIPSGVWTGVRSCNMMPGTQFASAMTSDKYLSQISIANFANMDATMTCNLDCDNGTLTMPERTFSPNATYSFSLSGNGSFTKDTLRIRMFYADNGRNKDTCTLIYTR